MGKCILTGSTEQRYFKVDDSMEKKWDTVIPVDLKTLFVSGTYICPAGHERVKDLTCEIKLSTKKYRH
jgi:NADH:ubiquinone oxidoreductase subunit B-like Fe-S oxidoreductase